MAELYTVSKYLPNLQDTLRRLVRYNIIVQTAFIYVAHHLELLSVLYFIVLIQVFDVIICKVANSIQKKSGLDYVRLMLPSYGFY